MIKEKKIAKFINVFILLILKLLIIHINTTSYTRSFKNLKLDVLLKKLYLFLAYNKILIMSKIIFNLTHFFQIFRNLKII